LSGHSSRNPSPPPPLGSRGGEEPWRVSDRRVPVRLDGGGHHLAGYGGGGSERGTRRRRRTRGRHGADTGRRNTGKARRRRVRASSARKLNKITADQTGETSGRRTRTTLRPRGITTAGPDRGDGHGAEAGARTLVFSLSTAARHRDGGRGRRARGSSAITAGRTDGTIDRRRGRR